MKNNRFRFIIHPHIVVYGVVTYGYDSYGKLQTITRGNTVYRLTYDAWNRPHETKVGGTALSENTYDQHGKLIEVTYANGFGAKYFYDDMDRVIRIDQCENVNVEEPAYVLTYGMAYNGEGDLYELRNYRTHRSSFFDYDHEGRCMASRECAFTVTNGSISYGAELSAYGYQYDACNNLTKLTCSVLGTRWSTVYTYDGDNRASTTTLASGKVLTNTYDTLGRLQNRTLKQGNTTIHETALTYVPGSGTGATTGLVATYQNGSDAAYSYTYDDIGNITEITQGTTSIGYEYDTASRLTRENNQVTNQTVTYEYDTWGNILNKKIYAYTTGSLTNATYTQVSYGYTNTAWGDQLTSYAGQTITYDSMGNPTSYRGYTFGWRGKQLTSASDGTNTLTFEYNEDGLRQKKVCNNISTDYYYNGSVLIGMQRGTSKFLFSYDASGNVVSVKYITANDTNEYYYLRNAQNDVVKLIDGTGATVVEYTYDTWGKKVQTTGTLAGSLGLIQPFRYRGYVYDYETGFYYLQSRYYDPTTGRFISADVLLSTGQGVLGHNAYAYCLGNPVNAIDIEGQKAIFWIIAAIAVTCYLSNRADVILFSNWLFGDGTDQLYTEGSALVKAFKNSKIMEGLIDDAIENYKCGQLETPISPEFTIEDNSELCLSIHQCHGKITVVKETVTKRTIWGKRKETRYAVTVDIDDRYNFEHWETRDLISCINNLAYYAHTQVNIGKDYEVKVHYTVYIPIKK